VAIESALRCPSCEDLSVAESSASTAVTVRATVAQLIAEGRTDQQIESYLVDRYGSSIVLDPPASGWSLLVWLLPLLGGLAALAALGGVFIRRRTVTDTDPTGPGGPRLAPPVLEERRHFLVQSLADADAEYLAGDLSDKDYLALRHRDMVRLAALGTTATTATEVEAGQGGLPRTGVVVADDPPSPAGPFESAAAAEPSPAISGPTRPPGRTGRNRWFLVGSVAAFGAALVTAVFLFATARQPGQSVTGSFAETPQQQTAESLAQAATDENQGQLDRAAQLYQSVLTKHPDNEVAMAQLGWLEFQTGRAGNNPSLVDDGTAKLNRAVRLDPNDYAVRLYLGTVLWQQDGDATAAVVQYRQFLADGPPAAIVKQAAPEVREAYQRAGDPIPPAVGG
jgi:cytochrome c-type biogenesis protein CcmH